ncbi:GntR family transcriptional regulator [Amedibacillus sp. YH-ame10]
MFVVDTHSKLPIFEQLKKQILEFISIGILSANDQLPSVRSLATQIGVNPNTVSKAYQELEEQGYIYTEKGKGCFVSDNETGQLIKAQKLLDFQTSVKEMKQHHIQKEELLNVIQDVYKEGIEND